MRGALTGAGVLALFDAPWVPIYILICFLVHPWIGVLAVLGGVTLPLIAWANERATRTRLDRAQTLAGLSYAYQEAALAWGDSIRAPRLSNREVECLKLAALGQTVDEGGQTLGISGRMVEFHLRNALEKLGAPTKLRAVILAFGAGAATLL